MGRGACRGIEFYNTIARSLDAQAMINAAAERKDEFGVTTPDARMEGQYLEHVARDWYKPIEAFDLGGKTVVLVEGKD